MITKAQEDIIADEYELAEAALASSEGKTGEACKMLRDECGWDLRRAMVVIKLVRAQQGAKP